MPLPQCQPETESLSRNHENYLKYSMRRRREGLLVRTKATRCHYCSHRAIEQVNRINPETGDSETVPYCGKC